MKARLGDPENDALSYYGIAAVSDIDRLRALYTFGIGLGMRESGGNTTEGRDTTVINPTAESAEAGLFQTSYDSLARSSWLPKLWSEYKANQPACQLKLFTERVPDRRAALFGSGPGAEFQEFTKECPAFSTQYAMVMLRINRTHFGPINRKEVELAQVCEDLFKEVEKISRQSCD